MDIMANEDFTTYTEVDPNSRITVIAAKVSWSLNRQESAWVYDDKGAAFFSGDFAHALTVTLSAASSGGFIMAWALTNDIDGYRTIYNAAGSGLFLTLGAPSGTDETISIFEVDGVETVYNDVYTFVGAMPHTVYLKIARDESVGTFGTLYCYIFSDAARTILLDTLSIALHTSKKDFRYIFACETWVDDGTLATTGYMEDLDLSSSVDAPTVTIQAITNIVTTTARGHGNVTDLGDANLTDYGFVLDDEAQSTPTITDSGSGKWQKYSLGAKTVIGIFADDFSGLTEGLTYAVRTYAINIYGTSYSSEVSFVAGTAGDRSFPTDPLLRVSGIKRTFFAGIDGKAVYQTQLTLGGISTAYISPISPREVPSVVTPTPLPSGQEFSQAAYETWLINNDIADIMRVFGHFPSYQDWVQRKQGGGL